MSARMLRRLALDALRAPDKLKDLADYQANKVSELFEGSKQELAAGGPAVLPAHLLSRRATASKARTATSPTPSWTSRRRPTARATGRSRSSRSSRT